MKPSAGDFLSKKPYLVHILSLREMSFKQQDWYLCTFYGKSTKTIQDVVLKTYQGVPWTP